MTTPPIRPDLRPPLKADRDSLTKFLKDRRPVLWIGAGAPVAAGYPGTNDLVRGMVRKRTRKRTRSRPTPSSPRS